MRPALLLALSLIVLAFAVVAAAWFYGNRGAGESLPNGSERQDDSPAKSPRAGVEQLIVRGDMLWREGRVREAEWRFEDALRLDPQRVLPRRRLAFMLAVEGRRWESGPHLFELLKHNEILVEELILLGDLWPDYELPSEVRRYLAAAPDDPMPRLGLARAAAHRMDHRRARLWLEEIVAADPDLTEARAWLGWTLVQANDTQALLDWERRLPAAAERHPHIWHVRGLAAQNRGQDLHAVRCFWEAVVRDPNHEQANYQLAVALQGLGHPELAEPFQVRAEQLYSLAAVLKKIHQDHQRLAEAPGAEQNVRQAVELCEQLGRLWEARQWSRVLLTLRPNAAWAREAVERYDQTLTAETPRTLPETNPANQIDLSGYPLPGGASPPIAGRNLQGGEEGPRREIYFSDRAAGCGLDFVQYNGEDPSTEETRLLETTGGGVGVLDFDGDGRQDLYFTQACPWPADPSQTDYRDRLFRNLGNGKFLDVTGESGLGDNRFSQGVAVGDVNNDGYPDIFLANVGGNRLYVNHGDGTFTDVLEGTDLLAEDWTSSCAIADINGDSLPDLYEVNYLAGDALVRECSVAGRPRTCPPPFFPGAADRLLLNLGDGRLEEVAARAGVAAPDGNGLGIVVADFDGAGQLSVFVANDGTPNFFYVNESPGRAPSFQNRAFLTGLACDRFGRFQACMGVAAGDANQDGWLDLFVTNFYDEANALYVSQQGRTFRDEALLRGVGEPSLKMLGFGAQFLDADLDGWPDLLVTNGHIEDRSAAGTPFTMPPQFFRNRGDGRFEELPSRWLGDFFRRELLGRGMARLDWNNDGREDVAISHMNDPVALLTNETTPVGNCFAVELRGVASSRDAVGARVEVVAGGRTRAAQIVAGDGYMASNQKQLVFGLGDEATVERMTVRWPSGLQQEFANPPVGQRLLIVEGAQQWAAFPLSR